MGSAVVSQPDHKTSLKSNEMRAHGQVGQVFSGPKVVQWENNVLQPYDPVFRSADTENLTTKLTEDLTTPQKWGEL
jgi:hypothetical protein